MDIYDQKVYKDLEVVLEKHRKLKSNLLVITWKGVGASYLLKSYVDKMRNPKIQIISDRGQKLSEFNLVDLEENFSVKDINNYLQVAGRKEKFVVLLEADIYESNEWQSSFSASHFYETYFLGARKKDDVARMVAEFKADLTKREIDEIYGKSGGLAKIVKALVVNWNSGDKDDVATKVAQTILPDMEKLSQESLNKLGLVDDGGRFRSELLSKLEVKREIKIEISFDLKLKENGIETGKVTADEKEILMEMMKNNGQVTKEKISDIKWGEGKYDKFSDQAINKTMRRLSEKLKQHKIETIPKVGFKLITYGGS